jgi:hypothetical protein
MPQRCQLDYVLLFDVYRSAHGCQVHRMAGLVMAYLGEHQLCQEGTDRSEAFAAAGRELRAAMSAVKMADVPALDTYHVT